MASDLEKARKIVSTRRIWLAVRFKPIENSRHFRQIFNAFNNPDLINDHRYWPVLRDRSDTRIDLRQPFECRYFGRLSNF